MRKTKTLDCMFTTSILLVQVTDVYIQNIFFPSQQLKTPLMHTKFFQIQVYDMETGYLQDPSQCGNVLKGFEGFLSSSKSTALYVVAEILSIKFRYLSLKYFASHFPISWSYYCVFVMHYSLMQLSSTTILVC